MSRKIQFLKFMDGVLGRGLACIFRRPVEGILEVGRVLFIRPGGIGDAVLLLPTIQALREAYPSAVIDVLAESRNGGVFALSPCVRRVFHYDSPGDLFSVIRGRYDLIIDTEQWHRLTAVVARLIGPNVSIGFATNERRRLFTNKVPYHQDRYEVDSFYDLLMPLGVLKPDQVPVPFIEVHREATDKVTEMLRGLKESRFVAFFPGASIPERRWGEGPFRELTERLHAEGVRVVVVGGPADQHEAGRIVAGGLGLNLAGKATLPETAAVIERSALLVSGDSGILHIGVGLGKPTVSLFGPGIAEKWAPRGDNHIVINKELPCSPCTQFGYTPKCPIDAKCLADISVNEVFDAVMQLLVKYHHQKDL